MPPTTHELLATLSKIPIESQRMVYDPLLGPSPYDPYEASAGPHRSRIIDSSSCDGRWSLLEVDQVAFMVRGKCHLEDLAVSVGIASGVVALCGRSSSAQHTCTVLGGLPVRIRYWMVIVCSMENADCGQCLYVAGPATHEIKTRSQ